MCSSVTISDLGWDTPDARPLLAGISLHFSSERVGLVGRNGTGKSTLLRLISGEMQPRSGSVRRRGSLGSLRQDLDENPEETVAELFGVAPALEVLDRAETGHARAGDLEVADWTLRARLETALWRVGLRVEPQQRLAALSGGQRTRAGIAALLFAAPDFLLLDEPTNNLDRAGRDAVIDLIRGWKGGAVIASHDRELLDHMDAIVELTTLGATRYGGNYRAYRRCKADELRAARHDVAHAEKTRLDLDRRARQAAERKARKDSAGRKGRAKGSQAKVLLDAEKERAEASGGANARMREARREAATGSVIEAWDKLEVLQPLSMEIASTRLPRGKLVLGLELVSAGYPPDHSVLRDISLSITGPERVVISGPNGSGKTTLLSLIAGRLEPRSGTVDLRVDHALLDQHVGLLDPALSLRDNFMHLNPDARDNECRTVLARFRFRAGDALQTVGTMSGGQKLRAGLACSLGRPRPPGLLILDEPTNHLDLDATEALEAALAAYDGALIVVSHDKAFLERLGPFREVLLPGRPAGGRSRHAEGLAIEYHADICIGTTRS